MPFLAFPGAAVLVKRISRFDKFKTGQTDEDPEPAFVMPNAIQRIIDFAASLAGFGADTFDGHVNSLVDCYSGIGRPRTLASQRASFPDPRSFFATGEKMTVAIRTASNR